MTVRKKKSFLLICNDIFFSNNNGTLKIAQACNNMHTSYPSTPPQNKKQQQTTVTRRNIIRYKNKANIRRRSDSFHIEQNTARCKGDRSQTYSLDSHRLPPWPRCGGRAVERRNTETVKSSELWIWDMQPNARLYLNVTAHALGLYL